MYFISICSAQMHGFPRPKRDSADHMSLLFSRLHWRMNDRHYNEADRVSCSLLSWDSVIYCEFSHYIYVPAHQCNTKLLPPVDSPLRILVCVCYFNTSQWCVKCFQGCIHTPLNLIKQCTNTRGRSTERMSSTCWMWGHPVLPSETVKENSNWRWTEV